MLLFLLVGPSGLLAATAETSYGAARPGGGSRGGGSHGAGGSGGGGGSRGAGGSCGVGGYQEAGRVIV
jgi:hypothetical protein